MRHLSLRIIKNGSTHNVHIRLHRTPSPPRLSNSQNSIPEIGHPFSSIPISPIPSVIYTIPRILSTLYIYSLPLVDILPVFSHSSTCKLCQPTHASLVVLTIVVVLISRFLYSVTGLVWSHLRKQEARSPITRESRRTLLGRYYALRAYFL